MNGVIELATDAVINYHKIVSNYSEHDFTSKSARQNVAELLTDIADLQSKAQTLYTLLMLEQE